MQIFRLVISFNFSNINAERETVGLQAQIYRQFIVINNAFKRIIELFWLKRSLRGGDAKTKEEYGGENDIFHIDSVLNRSENAGHYFKIEKMNP